MSLRLYENYWRKSKSLNNYNIFIKQRSLYRTLLKKSKKSYYNTLLKEASTNSKKLFSISNQLLGRISIRVLLNEPITTLVDTFDQYFNTKVMNIIKSLPTPLNEPYNLPLYSLSSFTLPSTTTIEKLLSAVNTSS